MFTSGPSYSQSLAYSQTQSDANQAQAKAAEAQTEVQLMRHDVDRLMMICEALWTFLKKEHGYTDEQLTQDVMAIDLRDGQLDGRTTQPAAAPCPKCGKINSARRARCIYCGEPLPVTLFAS